jgi:nitrite reductase (NADH) large subunit
MISSKPTLVVIGNGMVGQRFLEEAVQRELHLRYRIVTFCEESRPAYDRVHLSEYFSGRSAEDLSLVPAGFLAASGIEVHVGDRAVAIDREAKLVRSAAGREIPYAKVVLATGSYPFVPPIPGKDHANCFVYRTLEDLDQIQACAGRCRSGAVVGGGLLGLEAANALRAMGLETHVVEFAPQLMGVQVDPAGGQILRSLIEGLGVQVHTGKATTAIEAADEQRLARMTFKDESELAVDMIVFSAGIRPRDDLARDCGLFVGERGGVEVDGAMRSSDPDIYAIGEVALYAKRIYGLVAPGYTMAAVAAEDLAGAADMRFEGADMSTKLKLLGVDVASFGDGHGRTPGSRSYAISDEVAGTYARIVVDAEQTRLLGGILVGDASRYDDLLLRMREGLPLPAHPQDLILPIRDGGPPAAIGPAALPDSATICSCNNVSKGAIVAAVQSGARTLAELKGSTKTATGCGGCSALATAVLNQTLEDLGEEVDHSLCSHFALTRQELFHLVRVEGIKSFDALIQAHGRGGGCEICKPAVASILAACWNDYILEERHASLQDTNDHFLANMQRDGTYSVVPRVPGGEITPDKLIAIGEIAKQFDLYTKITGGQRIDLFGARVHQLPEIWRALIGCGFESGHAYGKAVRTVKTCVGSTWCRYGVQDSVGLGIRLEHRYKGLRAPHKLKLAVSGCTRECAEAQGKDVGVIATEQGYNLYVCGNGGMKPRHADLFATDLDEPTLLRYVDRFLMFYIRTADRLQRTSVWLENLDGGIDYLRQVVIEDTLGIATQLEGEMARLIDAYDCEWKRTIEDPAKLRRFRTYINHEQQDDRSLVYVRERGQRRPISKYEAEAKEVVA